MKGVPQEDGNYLLEDGVTLLDAQSYEAQLTDEDKGIETVAAVRQENAGDLLRMQNQILEQKARDLQSRLDSLAPKIEEKKVEPLGEGDAFNNPEKLMSRIQQMLDDQIKPLRESDAVFKRQQAYGAIKSKFRANNPAANGPEYAKLELIVDELMGSKEPTESNFIESVQRAVGMAALAGTFRQGTSDDSASNKQTNAPTKKVDDSMPAHLRPSSPVNPNRGAEDKIDVSQFNENEKRLMRENKQSPAEYVLFRDTPANELGAPAFLAKLKKIRAGGK